MARVALLDVVEGALSTHVARLVFADGRLGRLLLNDTAETVVNKPAAKEELSPKTTVEETTTTPTTGTKGGTSNFIGGNSRFSETAAAIARLGIFPRVRHFCLDDGHCFWWWVSDDALKTRRCPEEDCGDAEYNSPFE